jgi:hypothetical protein
MFFRCQGIVSVEAYGMGQDFSFHYQVGSAFRNTQSDHEGKDVKNFHSKLVLFSPGVSSFSTTAFSVF